MGNLERGFDFVAERSADIAEGVIKNTAKVAVVASVLGVGNVTAGLTVAAIDRSPQIYEIARRVVR